jgi:hypothetical protein
MHEKGAISAPFSQPNNYFFFFGFFASFFRALFPFAMQIF